MPTSGPIASTTPAPSCPSTAGHGTSIEPSNAFRSSLQTPLQCRRTRTSPGPGGASWSSTTRSRVPTAGRSAARVVTVSAIAAPRHEAHQLALEPAAAGLAHLER